MGVHGIGRGNEIIDKFKKVPYGLKVVAIGTTQCHYALDFAALGYKGFNMACYLNPMPFSRLLLERYRAHLVEGAAVLVTLEYPIFCINDFADIAKCNERQYAKILPGKNPYCPIWKQMAEYVLPLKKKDPMNLMLENMRFLERRNRYRNHFKPWELRQQCENLIQLGWEQSIGIPGYVMSGHLSRNVKAEKAMATVVEETVRTVELCKRYGWRPILVGLPYSGILNEYVPVSFKDKCFYENIRQIVDATGCELWDYSEDLEMQYVHNYLDIWYLNPAGRVKFTHKVLEDVSRWS